MATANAINRNSLRELMNSLAKDMLIPLHRKTVVGQLVARATGRRTGDVRNIQLRRHHYTSRTEVRMERSPSLLVDLKSAVSPAAFSIIPPWEIALRAGNMVVTS